MVTNSSFSKNLEKSSGQSKRLTEKMCCSVTFTTNITFDWYIACTPKPKHIEIPKALQNPYFLLWSPPSPFYATVGTHGFKFLTQAFL